MHKVIHVLSLKGIGGVQQAFLSYYTYAQSRSVFKHEIFSNFDIDQEYGKLENFYKLKTNFIKFFYTLCFTNSIIHLHNKLSNKKVWLFLKVFSVTNLIFHEHGEAWNIKSDYEKRIYRDNAQKAHTIIVNSVATKHLIMKKIGVCEHKIKVMYYGFKDPLIEYKRTKEKNLRVGFIGRFDLFKGLNVFIQVAKILHQKNIQFIIAGDGHLEQEMKEASRGYDSVQFIGRVTQAIEYIATLDILIVPSIREPLGIVNIEAGFCKIPVIATDVDGIPEVVRNNESGILLKADQEIDFLSRQGEAPLPDCVVNTATYELEKPKALCPTKVAEAVMMLANDAPLRHKLGLSLYESVRVKFSIESYFDQIEGFYKEIFDD